MSRYRQRRAKSLQNPEVAAGYWEMDSELKLVKALDLVREREGMTKEEMARRMQRQRVAISRLFNAERSNPTLETLHAALRALDLTAEVHLRRAREGDPPMTVKVDVPKKASA